MNMGMMIFSAVIVYGVICFVIAWRSNRGTTTSLGYFAANRSFGILVTVCTVAMGILSGLTFYGFPTSIMLNGPLVLAATGFGTVGLMYPLVGIKLWEVSRGKGYITTADFMRDRYESEGYGILVSLLQLVFIVPYMTVQFVAVGNGLEYSSGGQVSFTACTIIFAIFITSYLYVGGAKGTGMMDIFNALLAIIIPVIACFIIVGKNFGGSWSTMGKQALGNMPNMMDGPSFGTRYSAFNIFSLVLTGMIMLFSSPHLVSKMFMAKDTKTFKKMSWTGPILYSTLTIPIVMMGMIGAALYRPTIGDEAALLVPKMMLEQTPLIIVIAMLFVLFAFCMSTTNGFAFSAATIFSRDLVGRYGFKKVTDEEERDKLSIKIGKAGVILLMIICVIVSLTRPVLLVDYAYAFATPGFGQLLPPLLLGLYWKRASKQAAFAGTITGIIVLITTLWIIPYPLGIHPAVWSLGINTLVFLFVGFFTRPSDACLERFFGEEALAEGKEASK